MSQQLLYLSRMDVERVSLPMREIIDALESAFMEKARGLTEAPPKPGIHPRPECFLHAMPACVPSRKAAGIKWVAGYPSNPSRGLPYISGLLILNDPDTGLPLGVMDCTWITAKRTGAASALAARYLARPDSKLMGICGCGVQGRSHLEAFVEVLPHMEDVLLYDVNPRAVEDFLEEMEPRFPRLGFHRARSPEEVAREADVMVTAALILKEATPSILGGWLKKGSFASAVDFDCYWSREALEEMDLIVTDDQQQLAYYKSLGYFPRLPLAHAELAELVAWSRRGRMDPAEKTMAVFLGLAIEDMVTGLAILQRARKMGIGTQLPL